MIESIETVMEAHRLTACCAILLLLLLLLPIYKVNCQDYIEYKVKINSDGSAAWVITKVSDVNASIDTWEGFQTRIFNLVESASSITKREMAVDENSLQINTTISSGSKTTEYLFVWQDFSVNSNDELVFGDVFGVNGFFTQLYGEASLQISYPSTFTVKSVVPEPNVRDESACTLRWYRTQELVNGKSSVVLADKHIENTQSGIPQQYAIIGAVSAIGAAACLTGLYAIKRRHKPTTKINTTGALTSAVQVESEEDKILNILRASGSAMRQSDITEQCRFSKAKASQLLAALEKSGVITRYKKGRDKIVTLMDRVKGE